MLIISRKKDEKIVVADNIEITILEVGRNRVRFGISAPRDVIIDTRMKLDAAPPEVDPDFMGDKDADQELSAVLGPARSA